MAVYEYLHALNDKKYYSVFHATLIFCRNTYDKKVDRLTVDRLIGLYQPVNPSPRQPELINKDLKLYVNFTPYFDYPIL